jgi:nitrile hydratase
MSEDHPADADQPESSRRDFMKAVGVLGLSGGSAGAVGVAGLLAPTGEAEANIGTEGEPDQAREDLGGTPIYDDASVFPAFGSTSTLPPLEGRVLALKQLLIDKGIVNDAQISGFVDYYQNQVGPQFGKAVVVRAWIDPAFRDALLNPESPQFEPYKSMTAQQGPFGATWYVKQMLDGATNLPSWPPSSGTLGQTIGPEGEWLRVVFNGDTTDQTGGSLRVHNLVSCTLCSCYPQALLGIQPVWYKSQQYRARSISAPRGILREFADERGAGFRGALDTYLDGIDEVRVWDSNSEARFLVIPEPPSDIDLRGVTPNSPEEAALRERVSRNAMIGAEILYPSGL